MKVAISGYRRKIQAGWSVPPNGPFNALCQMGALLEKEIDVILKTTKGGYRSDPHPIGDEIDDNDSSDDFAFLAKPGPLLLEGWSDWT